MTANGYTVSFGNDENVLKIILVVPKFYEYTKRSMYCAPCIISVVYMESESYKTAIRK